MNFTPREKELIKYILLGYSNSEIAQNMFISIHTVKSFLENLYEKTSCHNRVQLVVYVLQNNLINSEQ